jgi:hypothetical protein
MGSASSVDHLTERSRQFYERTKWKTFLSIIFGACALTFLGFGSEGFLYKFLAVRFFFITLLFNSAAAQASRYNKELERKYFDNIDDDAMVNGYRALVSLFFFFTSSI